MSIKLKKTEPTNKQKHRTSTNRTTTWIVAFIIACTVAVGGSIGFYFLGRNQGYGSGAWDGYSIGYDNGYSDGYNDGLGGGYNNGYSAGRTNGYNAGYNAGYYDGYRKAGCAVFGGSYCY